jgi:hypothetical protein
MRGKRGRSKKKNGSKFEFGEWERLKEEFKKMQRGKGWLTNKGSFKGEKIKQLFCKSDIIWL